MSGSDLLVAALGLSFLVICIGVGLTQQTELRTIILGGRLVVIGVLAIVCAFALFTVAQVNP